MLETGPTVSSKATFQQNDSGQILNRLAILVGIVAFGLPVVLWLGANLGGSCMRHSISHFYYAQFLGSFFVGSLFFIGAFLIAYSGEHWIEDWGSNIAGLGAFGVALFPTQGDGCDLSGFKSRVFAMVTDGDPQTVDRVSGRDFFELFATVSNWHQIAAAAVFIYLGIYCLVVLKRIIPERHQVGGKLKPSKARRNRYYSLCGIIILICVGALAVKGRFGTDFLDLWNANSLTFYIEAIALWAFGLAWFIKGRIFAALND